MLGHYQQRLRRVCLISHVAILPLLLCCSSLVAQQGSRVNPDFEIDRPSKTLFLKSNPLALIMGPIPLYSGEARLGLELVGSERVSYQVAASYLFKSPIIRALSNGSMGVSMDDIGFNGYRFQGQIRYYFAKFYNPDQLSHVFIPSGLYASLHSSYSVGKMYRKDVPVQRLEFTNLNVNVIGGMQVMYEDHIGFDVFTGLGVKNNVIAFFDTTGNKEFLNPEDVGFGTFYGSRLKLILGFNLTFGLI